MPISRERFEQGLTPEQFIERMEVNKERFVDNIQANTFSFDDRQFFNDHPVSIAVLGEDWCTDVIHFLPVIIKLAEEVPSVKLSLFERDENLDLMDQYLKEGKYQSIPAIVVMDSDWNELGYYNERPAAVTKLMGAETQRFAKDNPQLEGANRSYENMPEETRLAVRENSSNFRWNNMLEWNRIFIEDLKALVSGGVAVAK